MSNEVILWIVFNVVVAGLLYVDLKVINRHAHVVPFREAAFWSVVWISLALLFNFGIYHFLGRQKALEFLTGYIIEESLSVAEALAGVRQEEREEGRPQQGAPAGALEPSIRRWSAVRDSERSWLSDQMVRKPQ